MPDPGELPVLSAAERTATESLLSAAWDEPVELCTAEAVWQRSHVVRLGARGGRAAILKRPRRPPRGGEPDREPFGTELASLEYLGGMPAPVAPRLLGADVSTGILVMEELPAGRSLADALLAGDRADATASMAAYASALGSVHAWSIGRTSGFEHALARYGAGASSRPWYLERIERERDRFLQVVSALGLAADGAGADIGAVIRTLADDRYLSFVHGDLCPDNVRLADGRMRFFDFERSYVGPAALDAAYLLAPFPSCWCFAELPADVTTLALRVYRRALEAGGVEAGPEFDAQMTAVLASWVVARAAMIDGALNSDRQWGTTTIRPRLVAWTGRLAAVTATTGMFPRLRMVAEGLNTRFRALWPEAVIPAYPALADSRPERASVPEGWEPGI